MVSMPWALMCSHATSHKNLAERFIFSSHHARTVRYVRRVRLRAALCPLRTEKVVLIGTFSRLHF